MSLFLTLLIPTDIKLNLKRFHFHWITVWATVKQIGFWYICWIPLQLFARILKNDQRRKRSQQKTSCQSLGGPQAAASAGRPPPPTPLISLWKKPLEGSSGWTSETSYCRVSQTVGLDVQLDLTWCSVLHLQGLSGSSWAHNPRNLELRRSMSGWQDWCDPRRAM